MNKAPLKGMMDYNTEEMRLRDYENWKIFYI